MAEIITIELKHLRFFAYHGWHEEEAVLGNEFEVTLLATFQAKENISHIEDTVDYGKVFEIVKAVFSEQQKLLETVAQQLIQQVQKKFPQILNIELTITKLNPMLPQFTGTIGITYRKDFR